MEKELQKLLYTKGSFRHYRGCIYFMKAVNLAYENPERLQNICKELYLPIALNYSTDVKTVEKDIRQFRDVFMKNDGGELLTEISGAACWQTRSPFPREMIEIFVYYLENLAP